MFMKKGQSILEYTVLIGIVCSAILIMQVYLKRGVQGSWKDSADKMGPTFSAGGTTVHESRALNTDQTITEEVTTGNTINKFVPEGTIVKGTLTDRVHSYTSRAGGQVVSESKVATDSANQEKIRWVDYQTNTVADFTSKDIDF